jgi:MFS family permease
VNTLGSTAPANTPGSTTLTSRSFLRTLPLGLSIALSLFGDLSLFAGLVTQLQVVNLSLADVGVILSVHRLVRIPGNLVVGYFQDRLGRRRLFVLGMILAVVSTAGYGLVTGFWPFVLMRVLWGIAWALLNVCGTTLVLDMSTDRDRGSLTGFLSAWIWVGYAVGPLVGGLLTDALSFQRSMLICSALTAIGLAVSILFIRAPRSNHRGATRPRPNHRGATQPHVAVANNPQKFHPGKDTPAKNSGVFNGTVGPGKDTGTVGPGKDTPAKNSGVFNGIFDLFDIFRQSLDFRRNLPILNRTLLAFMVVQFAGDGVLMATLTLLLTERLGQVISLGSLQLDAVAAGGAFIAARAVLAGLVALGAGRLSDSFISRPRLVEVGLVIAAAGMGILALAGSTAWILVGLAVSSLSSGILLSILPAMVRDYTSSKDLGRSLGAYAMIGDIGSTAGPAVAFAVAPLVGLAPTYGLCLAMFAAAFFIFKAGNRMLPVEDTGVPPVE